MLMIPLESINFTGLTRHPASSFQRDQVVRCDMYPHKMQGTSINTCRKKSGHRDDSLGNSVLQQTDYGFGIRFFKDLILVPLYGTLTKKK